ncbi:hypothetical protein Gasu2_21540 [Galdieria sulphuraria]|uniref:BSD domain-containing protein n=1 Tax=Galdieria sulphuraria TaxID=130081 RepID=M2VXD2_GALSU|nr:uncharacterized protein Gasu_45680 [Galdieria sulphuraria]EME27906.1 hypothetical protein Gasu_45680 [Galdieria sulphuraria]GJD07817.1 hypothetical protein Gasu2_21540 [Galdieria sulphuraria]|eukprot:XP_005704426.1 hypothetical protein Gasu_45680 [Galdieria sulphuraria]
MAQDENKEQPKKDWKTIISPQYWKNSVSLLFTDAEQGNFVLPSLQSVSFSKASETIGKQVKESAKELGALFSAEECPSQQGSKEAPWEVLTAREKPFAKEIEERILKITSDCYRSRKEREEIFLSLSSLKDSHFRWSNNSSEKMKQAMAALEKDPILPDLRAGLVPKRMSEENFWRQYFYLVEKVKKSVVTNSQFGLFDEWESWSDTTSHPTLEHSQENSDLDNEVDQVLNDVLE